MGATPVMGQLRNGSGTIYAGVRVYVYAGGTSTPSTIYTDAGLSTEDTNPSIGDAQGVFKFFIDDAGGATYKIVVKTSDDSTTIYSRDNIDPTEGVILTLFNLGAEDDVIPYLDDIASVSADLALGASSNILNAEANALAAAASATDAETAETNATAVANNITAEANSIDQAKATGFLSQQRSVLSTYENFFAYNVGGTIYVAQGVERATGYLHFYPSESAIRNTRNAYPAIDRIADVEAKANQGNARLASNGYIDGLTMNGLRIWGTKPDGTFRLPHEVEQYRVDNARLIGKYIWRYAPDGSTVALGVRPDMTTDMNASFHTKDKFFATPSTVSSSIDNYMPLELERYYDTLVSHGGITFSARQVKYKTNGAASTLKTLLINSVSDGVLIPVIGQSNAGEGGSEGLVITEEMFPHSVMNFDGPRTKTGTSDLDTTALTDFRPAKDTAAAHYVGTLASYALEMMHRQRTGYPTPGILTATSWEGGKDISFFKQGTTNYDNLIGYGERAKAVFANYGRGVQCPYIVYVQGESGLTSVELQTLASNLTGDMQTALGLASAPKLLVIQVNETEDESLSVNTAIQDIYDAAAASSDIVFGGVMYDCTMDDGLDVIHTDAMGGCMLGERIAMAVYCALTGETLPTFDVDSATASGTSCEITFTHDYVIENDWFVPQSVEDISGDGIDDGSGGDKLIGFNYSDASGTTSESTYTQTSSTVLTLNLDATVSMSPTLSIARDLTLTQSNSFTKTRANVYRNSGFRSPFHDYFKSRPDRLAATGRTNVPEEIRIYCPIREISL